jgi:flagellar biogenesis protein FliO
LACRSPKSSRGRRALAAVVFAAALAPAGFAAAQQPSAKEPIPFRREADVDSGTALRVALALGLVIALGVGGVYALKRFLPGSLGGAAGTTTGRINVLEVRRVTPRLTLYLVEIDGEKFALVQSGDRVRPLTLRPRS